MFLLLKYYFFINIIDFIKFSLMKKKIKRVFSSVGRASALQAGGQRFEPVNTHHFIKKIIKLITKHLNLILFTTYNFSDY
jgi:hypothetical protein